MRHAHKETPDTGDLKPTKKQYEYLADLRERVAYFGIDVGDEPEIETRREYSQEISRLKDLLRIIRDGW